MANSVGERLLSDYRIWIGCVSKVSYRMRNTLGNATELSRNKAPIHPSALAKASGLSTNEIVELLKVWAECLRASKPLCAPEK